MQCRTLHLCGDPAALPLVRQLLELAGDSLEVRDYARLSTLRVEDAPLRSLRDIRPGDAVVAFSRRQLFKHKRDIEMATGLRVGVVYGALPPALRREQALRFNARDALANPGGTGPGAGGAAGAVTDAAATPASATAMVIRPSTATAAGAASDPAPSPPSLEPSMVLVATDAIGLGLNLTIQRIVFSAMTKFDGTRVRNLTVSEVKQIAGRAGRGAQGGLVTGFQRSDLPRIRAALGQATPAVASAGVLPTLEQLEAFAASLIPEFQGLQAGYGDDEDDEDAGEGNADDVDCLDLSNESDSDDDGEDGEPRVRDTARAGEFKMPAVSPDDESDGFSYHVLDAHFPQVDDAGDDPEMALVLQGRRDQRETKRHAAEAREEERRMRRIQRRLERRRQRRLERAAELAQSIVPFSVILERFFQDARVDPTRFHVCNTASILQIAKIIDEVPMRFQTRWTYCMAPVNTDDQLSCVALKKYATWHHKNKRVNLALKTPTELPRTPDELADLESVHAVFDLYLWLGFRFPQEYEYSKRAMEATVATQSLIQQGLETIGKKALKVAREKKRATERAATRALPRKYLEDGFGEDDDPEILDSESELGSGDGSSDYDSDEYEDFDRGLAQFGSVEAYLRSKRDKGVSVKANTQRAHGRSAKTTDKKDAAKRSAAAPSLLDRGLPLFSRSAATASPEDRRRENKSSRTRMKQASELVREAFHAGSLRDLSLNEDWLKLTAVPGKSLKQTHLKDGRQLKWGRVSEERNETTAQELPFGLERGRRGRSRA
jgi:hypothetical protein